MKTFVGSFATALSIAMTQMSAIAGPPFKYPTPCYLEIKGGYIEDVCTVVETREKTGALKSRNIFSNRFQLTVKSRFDAVKGFVTWDSHNQFEYKWEYKVGSAGGKQGSYVMPGFLIDSVSWD